MPEQLQTINIELEHPEEVLALFGTNDRFLRHIEQELQVQIVTRGKDIRISGDTKEINLVSDILHTLIQVIQKGIEITERDVVYAVQLAKDGKINQLETLFADEITRNAKDKPIRVKTLGQKKYVSAIKNNDLVFGIGPAGTGKTFLAVVMAVHVLRNGLVKRIILTRPAVEAGESLGFLPGDLKEKVDPYLRPLYDGLKDVLGVEHTRRLIERDIIEIATLAYMRGRSLDNAFVILDEDEYTTSVQINFFLKSIRYSNTIEDVFNTIRFWVKNGYHR